MPATKRIYGYAGPDEPGWCIEVPGPGMFLGILAKHSFGPTRYCYTYSDLQGTSTLEYRYTQENAYEYLRCHYNLDIMLLGLYRRCVARQCLQTLYWKD
jgi:hypothetical protein